VIRIIEPGSRRSPQDAPAKLQLVDQPQDVGITGKPVMIETLQDRTAYFEPTRQTTELGSGLDHGYRQALA
jgi:hypothetical protein